MYHVRYEKPLLLCGQKRCKRIAHLKQWHECSGKRKPYHNGTRKKTNKTERLRMAKIAREKLKYPPGSHDRTKSSLSCHQNIN